MSNDEVEDEAVIQSVLVSTDTEVDDRMLPLRTTSVHMWMHVDRDRVVDLDKAMGERGIHMVAMSRLRRAAYSIRKNIVQHLATKKAVAICEYLS